MKSVFEVTLLVYFIFVLDHFPLLVELEMTPTVGTSNGLISRR